MSLGSTLKIGEEDIYKYCIDNKCVALGWGGNIDYKECIDKEEVYKKFYSCNGEDDRGFNVDAMIVLKWDEARGYYFCFGREL